MKHDSDKRASCTPCFLAGKVAPWAFLGGGAVLSILDISPYLDKTAAYLAAMGLGIMAVSFLMAHASSARLAHRDR